VTGNPVAYVGITEPLVVRVRTLELVVLVVLVAAVTPWGSVPARERFTVPVKVFSSDFQP